MGAEVQTEGNLKHLGFVKGYGGYFVHKSYDLSSSLYTSTRSFVPGQFQPRLKAIEDTVTGYTAPLVQQAQDQTDKAWKFADGTFDTALNKASGLKGSVLEFPKKIKVDNIPYYTKSHDVLLKRVNESVEFFKSHGLTGTAKYAADSVLAAVEEAKKKVPEFQTQELIAKVQSSWTNLVNTPQVKQIIATTQDTVRPPVDFAWKKYLAAHDAVVASSQYNKVYQVATGALDGLQSGVLYKQAKDRFYPVISPIASPTLEKITHSPYYSELLEHLKPISSTKKRASHIAG